MRLFYLSISLAVISTVLYHVFQKLTSVSVNPTLALAATFATATVICLVLMYLVAPTPNLWESLRQLNWASFALAFAIVGADIGFLLAYRAGWTVSLGPLVANVSVTLVLMPIGLLFFKEKISFINSFGGILCIIGLLMVNHK